MNPRGKMSMAMFFIIFVSMACLFGCERVVTPDPVEHNFSGDELFKAFLLGEVSNPIARKFPEFFEPIPEAIENFDFSSVLSDEKLAELEQHNLTAEDIEQFVLKPDKLSVEVALERQRIIRESLAFIQNEDQTFFDRFGERMQSGNQIQVESALQEALQKLELASKALYDDDIDKPTDNPASAPGRGRNRRRHIFIERHIFVERNVFVEHHVVVEHHAAVERHLFTRRHVFFHRQGSVGQLQREYYIDLVTIRLHDKTSISGQL